MSMESNLQVASVHLIDEEKHFAKGLDKYVEKCYVGESNNDAGLNYHVVSVFGSQSTGKSTLLNRLFGTQFDVMDEEKRQQTTKGIWFSHANYIASTDEDSNGGKAPNDCNIYVLDVEGVDGRERADDKDFERKSALFALATSEVLIVNIFEHQVGLYQGANMELLKTVMEVNLSLFYKQHEKCLLLFVIRDFTGLTPISNLGNSLEADMNKIWSDLNKPDECKDCKLGDFFDLKFSSISHKHYQPENFELDIKHLGDKFANDFLFDNNKYHKKIPIDAWALYSENIWAQIENNKDLDLPTQQILVSKFKCNEILNTIFNEMFLVEFTKVENASSNPLDSCRVFKNLRLECLSAYDSQASRYKPSVYADVKIDLINKIDSNLNEFYSTILSHLTDSLLSLIDSEFNKLRKSNPKEQFKELLNKIVDEILTAFNSKAGEFLLVDDSEQIELYHETYAFELNSLKIKLDDFQNLQRMRASNLLVSKLSKKLQLKFKDFVIEELSQPTFESWDNISIRFDSILEKILKPYFNGSFYDFQLDLNELENEKLHLKLLKSMWKKFDSVTHDFINDDSVCRILRCVFEDSFKFDPNGLPLIWKNFNQLDAQFNKARDDTLKLLPILSSMKLSSGKTIQKPKFNIDDDYEENGNDSDQDYNSVSELDSDGEESNGNTNNKFSVLLTAKQQAKVRLRLKRETDAIYLDAKRSMVANKTSIPTFMYILLIILGWNEFMAILRNPVLFILAIITITGLYFAYNMQMLGPLLTVANAMLNQSKVVVKEKLRDILLDEKERPVSSNASDNDKIMQEKIELDDL